MGQKTNPIGFRLGITKHWRSRWFATKDYPQLLKEDELLRKYLRLRRFPGNASPAIADIIIDRKPGKVVVTLHTGRPGVVIGKKGEEVEKLKSELQQITGKDVGINVEEIKRPEIEAQLVADNIAAPAGAAHLVPPRHEARGAERHADGRRRDQGEVRRAAWAAPRSRAPRATTRDGCRCTRCGPTSTTRPARRRRPSARSA